MDGWIDGTDGLQSLAVTSLVSYCYSMSLTLTELAEEAMALPTEGRAYLVEKLLETLDFEENFVVSDSWLNEIRKRCEQVDKKQIGLIPADTAIAEMRQSLA
jgi:hypothetical protein